MAVTVLSPDQEFQSMKTYSKTWADIAELVNSNDGTIKTTFF